MIVEELVAWLWLLVSALILVDGVLLVVRALEWLL
jgi:hypothetical protein